MTTPGNYFFHLNVQYGSEISSAFKPFTVVAAPVTPPVNPPGGGGGGGGGGSAPASSQSANVLNGTMSIADLNRDGKVNSIDFSILLYYWKSKPPYKNQYVDINKDSKVDSVDFSILLYWWDKK